MAMPVDMEEQYDRIYRYCYFRLHSRQTAEDITQETFLRYLENYACATAEQALKCLYTIARNLCVDAYRKKAAGEKCVQSGAEDTAREGEFAQTDRMEEQLVTGMAVRAAVAALAQDEQEILLLRFVNEVPAGTLAQLYGISRFAVYRRLAAVTKKFREALSREGLE